MVDRGRARARRHGSRARRASRADRQASSAQGIGVARARSPLGPFEKLPSPLVRSGQEWLGPGHASIVDRARGERYLAYHAYRASEGVPSCKAGGNKRRHVLLEPLELADAWPRIAGG